MADYPVRSSSKRVIRDAGKLLAGTNLSYTEDVVSAFRVAHNWRMSHIYPLIRERMMLSRYAGPEGLTAGRIKRMDSIRKKLRRSPISLTDMQDLAGIRAIMLSIEQVRAVADRYAGMAQLRRTDDYIAQPKLSGYRSLHLVKSFAQAGRGEAFAGQRVEIQIRTRHQHAWATAVEAIGALRHADMKAGEGEPDWLRFLALMSGHIARFEDQPIGADLPQDAQALRTELRDLNRRLGAVAFLSAVRALDAGERGGRFFLLQLDADRGTASARPLRSLSDAGDSYFAARDQGEAHQTIIVAVDGLGSLRQAYPNYFLDMGLFLEHIQVALGAVARLRL